jgi:hypothetical protein
MAAGCALLVFLAPVAVYAQGISGSASPENTKTETTTPAKLQIVLCDYEGTAKVSSLAYTFPLVVSGKKLSGPYAELRIGIRVPVATTASKTGENSPQYIDAGTNIDARAAQTDDGRYQLDLRLDRFPCTLPDGNRTARSLVRNGPPAKHPLAISQWCASIAVGSYCLCEKGSQPKRSWLLTR